MTGLWLFAKLSLLGVAVFVAFCVFLPFILGLMIYIEFIDDKPANRLFDQIDRFFYWYFGKDRPSS